MNWESATAAFIGYKQREGCSSITCSISRGWIAHFQAFCAEQAVTLDQVAPAHIAGYQRALMWQPNRNGRLNAPNTVDQALRVVRMFCRWCHGRGVLSEDPVRYLILGRPVQPLRNHFAADELKRLLDLPDRNTALGLRDRLLLILIAATELGLAGCESLTVEDRPPLDGHLEPDLWAYLRKGRPEFARETSGNALLLVREGTPMCVATMKIRVAILGRQAGLSKMSPRRLRQSYAVQFQARGRQLTLSL